MPLGFSDMSNSEAWRLPAPAEFKRTRNLASQTMSFELKILQMNLSSTQGPQGWAR
jgi:hypothetical protein